MIRITHRKTGHTQIITNDDWNKLKAKGWHAQFTFEVLAESRKPSFIPPEIKSNTNNGRQTKKFNQRPTE